VKPKTQPLDKATLEKALALNDITAMFSVLPALLKEVERLKAGPAGWTEDFQKTVLKRIGLDGEFAIWGIDAIEMIGRSLVKARLERDAYRQGLFQIASRGCEAYGSFNMAETVGTFVGCGKCDRCLALAALSRAQQMLDANIGPKEETQRMNSGRQP
jgi:hypothetical protein